MNGLISTKDTFDWLHICLNNKKNLYVQSGITGMIGMTGISGKLGISDIIIPRWYKSFPGPPTKRFVILGDQIEFIPQSHYSYPTQCI